MATYKGGNKSKYKNKNETKVILGRKKKAVGRPCSERERNAELNCNDYRGITVPSEVLSCLIIRICAQMFVPEQSPFVSDMSDIEIAILVWVERRRKLRQRMLAAFVYLKEFYSMHCEAPWDLLRVHEVLSSIILLHHDFVTKLNPITLVPK